MRDLNTILQIFLRRNGWDQTFYEQIYELLTPTERNELHEIMNGANVTRCIECLNGTCRVSTEEKYGEPGCIAWTNPYVAGKFLVDKTLSGEISNETVYHDENYLLYLHRENGRRDRIAIVQMKGSSYVIGTIPDPSEGKDFFSLRANPSAVALVMESSKETVHIVRIFNIETKKFIPGTKEQLVATYQNLFPEEEPFKLKKRKENKF